MNTHASPTPRDRRTHRRRFVALATVASLAAAGTLLPAGASSGNDTTDDVIDWMSATDPTLVVDTTCARPANAHPVAYTRDRIVVRTTAPTVVRTRINAILDPWIPGPNPTGGWIASQQTFTPPLPPAPPAITPVVVFTLKPRPDTLPHQIVRLSRALRNEAIKASPDYAMTPTPFVKFWPAGAPTPTATLAPQRTLLTPGGQPVGTGVRLDIYDTGMAITNQGAFLTDVQRLAAKDQELPDANLDGIVNYPHAGHGVAMAGVIKTLTPGVTIRQGKITDALGLATDVSAAKRTLEVLNNTPAVQWPDIIVYAFGSTACDRSANQALTNDAALEPLALQAVLDVVARFDSTKSDGIVIVASSGNRATTQPFFPAAFNALAPYGPAIVSVGAYDATRASDGNASAWFSSSRSGPVSDYSNTGTWVEAYAPGDALATTHLNGLRWDVGGDLVSGRAIVSGTSFAAPYVAALIAERLSSVGGKVRPAWTNIRSRGVAPIPPCDGDPRTIGAGLAVGLPSLTSAASANPTGNIGTC